MADPKDSRHNWQRSIPAEESWGGCRWCVHFRIDGTCVAYPERIPSMIEDGQVDHLVPRPGQVGETVFERSPDGMLVGGRRFRKVPA
jgi:hypothetical protein